MYEILFIGSSKSAGALATPKDMTFYLNTCASGVLKASNS